MGTMDRGTDVAFITIALALLAGIMAWLGFRYRRSKLLRDRFAPEYDRLFRKEGNVRRSAEFREKSARHSTSGHS